MNQQAQQRIEELKPKEKALWDKLMALENSKEWKSLQDKHRKLQDEWCLIHRQVEALELL